MSFEIRTALPWGRSMQEYERMFGLGEEERSGRILGCSDGPASFNAEMKQLGRDVVSVDPLYAHSREAIAERIEEARKTIMGHTREHMDSFVWKEFPSLEALERTRLDTMETFLNDYDAGLAAGRYLDHALPKIPFKDGEFDLALCSHFLFTYSEAYSEVFHIDAVVELLRVAREVRIFPLLNLDGVSSPNVEPVRASLSESGYEVCIDPVPYEFQRGANQMMRITKI